MQKLNRRILSSGNFWGRFIGGGFFGGILSSGDFILQAIFCGGFYPLGNFIRGGFFPDTLAPIMHALKFRSY